MRASLSLLMATMFFESFMPERCWVALASQDQNLFCTSTMRWSSRASSRTRKDGVWLASLQKAVLKFSGDEKRTRAKPFLPGASSADRRRYHAPLPAQGDAGGAAAAETRLGGGATAGGNTLLALPLLPSQVRPRGPYLGKKQLMPMGKRGRINIEFVCGCGYNAAALRLLLL